MAIRPTSFEQRAHVYRDLARVLLIVATIVVVVMAMTVVFGLQGSGPSLEILPDPAGPGLPF